MGCKLRSMKRKVARSKRQPLVVIRPQVAGLDVGSQKHYVCCPIVGEQQSEVQSFGTTTPELERLADWLVENEIESVAMESTSVYWIPLYELLESRGIEVVLANARHLNHVPGRKTDVLDCQWLQQLHSCGLVKGSFRPADTICQWRALQRERAKLEDECKRTVQRMQKALDQMNVQVHRAVSDLTGFTGMAMVRAIVSGERDALRLAELRDKRCKKSVAEIAAHLTGNWRDEHLFNLTMALRLYDHLQQILSSYDEKIEQLLVQLQPPERADVEPPPHPKAEKYRQMCRHGDDQMRTSLYRVAGVDLTRIDGINCKSAQIVLSEVGLDLSVFPTERHFFTWLRLSPKTAWSGGKPLGKKYRGTGATRVSAALRMAALALRRSSSALGAYFRRLARRKGMGTAVFATARKLATYIYRMLRHGQGYIDIGQKAYEEQFSRRRLYALTSAARSIGYELVAIEPQNQVSG